MEEKRPLAASIFQSGPYRVTVLTPMLLRVEYDISKTFEDRISQIVVNRRFPAVKYNIAQKENRILLRTDAAELDLNTECFDLSVSLGDRRWHWGEPLHNYGGTVRTLDQADGAVPLEDGLFSKEGIGVLEDASCLLTDAGPEARRKGTRDVYLFLYGCQFEKGLQDFYCLCGQTPLLPRYALGNWWSRYWPYSQEEYIQLMDRFREEDIPFSVAVLDMDWHITKVPEGCDGWTGFSWNRELFPDPPALLQELHNRGVHTTLNLHPAKGVQYFEDQYPQVAEAMGVKDNAPVAFDFTDEKFREVYFKLLLEPLEKEGVDFWWIDWQQGTCSKIPGLDPLWLLNHYHYENAREKGERPLILSRYAGPGSHRYPVGFSGDTIVSWDSLRFQPFFTAAASNIGYSWWSHDIGGHMNGVKDDELTCRWVQFGVFSPINRLHSTCNRFAGKEPWNYGIEACEIMKRFLRLRTQLIPYLYAMNYRSSCQGIPLIRPMYHVWPDQKPAYCYPGEYVFGSEMIAAPVTEKRDPVLGLAPARVWLPEGTYYDFFTGISYAGNRELTVYRALTAMPVFVKAGGIVPMEQEKKLVLRIYPGADASFRLHENEQLPEGTLLEWKDEDSSLTFSDSWGEQPCRACFCGRYAEKALVTVNGEQRWIAAVWDSRNRGSVVELPEGTVRVSFPESRSAQEDFRRDELSELLRRAQIPFDIKEELFRGSPENLVPGRLTALPGMLAEAILEIYPYN